MEEGQISAWHKQEGESIGVDDLLAEIETDKATMEYRSFDKGTLLRILAPAGRLSTVAPGPGFGGALPLALGLAFASPTSAITPAPATRLVTSNAFAVFIVAHPLGIARRRRGGRVKKYEAAATAPRPKTTTQPPELFFYRARSSSSAAA